MEFKDAWDCAKLEEEEDFSGGSCGKYQQRLWDLSHQHPCQGRPDITDKEREIFYVFS